MVNHLTEATAWAASWAGFFTHRADVMLPVWHDLHGEVGLLPWEGPRDTSCGCICNLNISKPHESVVGGPRCGECGAGALWADITRHFWVYGSSAKGSVPGVWWSLVDQEGPSGYPHPFPSHSCPTSEQLELLWDLHPSVVSLGPTSLPAQGFTPQLGERV